MIESRMFWLRLNVLVSVMPRLENFVPYDTELVRVDCVSDCGLYIDVRLLRS